MSLESSPLKHLSVPVVIFLLLWLSVPSGLLVVFEKPNRSSFIFTLTLYPRPTGLRELDLSRCTSLDFGTLRHLARQCRHLSRLKLHHTHVGDSHLINAMCLDVKAFAEDRARAPAGAGSDPSRAGQGGADPFAVTSLRSPGPGRMDVRVRS